MTDVNPLVSIIIPTYNRASLIEQTLLSVQNQTYGNWECIIVDDFSTDNTRETVNTFCSHDNRFIYHENIRKKGAQGSRNTGLNVAKADYLIFLDSDDLLSPQCLEKRINFLHSNPDYDLYCFPTGVFNVVPFDTNYVWNYLNKPVGDLERFLQQDMPWCGYGTLWRKSLLNELNGWDESLFCWHDWDIHVRVLMHNGIKYIKAGDEIKNIDSFYRVNSSYVSIADLGNGKLCVESKMLMINKIVPSIKLLKSDSIKLEFARLVFRISHQAVQHVGYAATKKFFTKALHGIRLSKIFIWFWAGYLHNLCFTEQNHGSRRIYNLALRLYQSSNLLKQSSTHLLAVYSR